MRHIDYIFLGFTAYMALLLFASRKAAKLYPPDQEETKLSLGKEFIHNFFRCFFATSIVSFLLGLGALFIEFSIDYFFGVFLVSLGFSFIGTFAYSANKLFKNWGSGYLWSKTLLLIILYSFCAITYVASFFTDQWTL